MPLVLGDAATLVTFLGPTPTRPLAQPRAPLHGTRIGAPPLTPELIADPTGRGYRSTDGRSPREHVQRVSGGCHPPAPPAWFPSADRSARLWSLKRTATATHDGPRCTRATPARQSRRSREHVHPRLRRPFPAAAPQAHSSHPHSVRGPHPGVLAAGLGAPQLPRIPGSPPAPAAWLGRIGRG